MQVKTLPLRALPLPHFPPSRNLVWPLPGPAQVTPSKRTSWKLQDQLVRIMIDFSKFDSHCVGPREDIIFTNKRTKRSCPVRAVRACLSHSLSDLPTCFIFSHCRILANCTKVWILIFPPLNMERLLPHHHHTSHTGLPAPKLCPLLSPKQRLTTTLLCPEEVLLALQQS